MENSKLIALLRTFDASELRAFKDFVSSPYFNKKDEICRLYAYLKKLAANDFPAAKLQRATVFAAVYPNQAYDERQLNYTMSLLLKLAEQFVGLQPYENWGIVPDYQILKSSVERHLDKNYQYQSQQAMEKLEQVPYRNEDYFFQRYLLADVADAHFTTKNERRFDAALQDAADYFDLFYLSKKLKYLCQMLDRQQVVASNYQLHFLEELKIYLSNNVISDTPAIAIYYQLLLALTESEPAPYFHAFRQMLQTAATVFPAQEMRLLYQFAINFRVRQIRFGAKEYIDDVLSLYREGVESEVLLDNGHITPWTFKNMVKLGLGLQQYDWVQQFVTKYSSKLEADQREDAYHFNLADLYYHRKEYNQALQHFNQVAFSDTYYHLGAKVMLLKIYYETQETEALASLISTFRVFLQRNKSVPKEVKTPYLNFVNILYELLRHGEKRSEVLREKIANTSMLTDQSWLLAQLAARR